MVGLILFEGLLAALLATVFSSTIGERVLSWRRHDETGTFRDIT
jgi:hypothetical protein